MNKWQTQKKVNEWLEVYNHQPFIENFTNYMKVDEFVKFLSFTIRGARYINYAIQTYGKEAVDIEISKYEKLFFIYIKNHSLSKEMYKFGSSHNVIKVLIDAKVEYPLFIRRLALIHGYSYPNRYKFNRPPSSGSIYHAIKNGYNDLVIEELMRGGFYMTPGFGKQCVKCENLKLLKIYTSSREESPHLFESAIIQGNLDIVKHLYDCGYASNQSFKIAVANGQLKIAQWFYHNSIISSIEMCRIPQEIKNWLLTLGYDFQ